MRKWKGSSEHIATLYQPGKSSKVLVIENGVDCGSRVNAYTLESFSDCTDFRIVNSKQ